MTGIIERNGVRLHVEDHGSGPPVIFQHGLGADASQVAEIFPDTPPVRRVTVECRAQGRSDAGPPADFAIATFADDVLFVAGQLGIERAVVGGISMGAALSLRLAATRPDFVRGLVLARPAWLFSRAPENTRAIAYVGELLTRHAPADAWAIFEASDIAARFAREAPDNLASLRGYFDRPNPKTAGALLAAIADDWPGVSEAEIRKIGVPTLVIGHGDDLIHPLEHARVLAQTIPHARLAEITSKVADRGRYVSEFRDALSAFLAGLPA